MASSLLARCAFLATVLASPAQYQRDVLPAAASSATASAQITTPAQLDAVFSGIKADSPGASLAAAAYLNLVSNIVPAPTPTAIVNAVTSVASVYEAHPSAFLYESTLNLVVSGLTPADIAAVLTEELPATNSNSNYNPITPSPAIYPTSSKYDAPYDIPESQLRAAIYIPLGFTYGAIRPMLFVPGTGATAYSNYATNFGKVFQGSSYADAVYLNIPNHNLDDIQTNSEYVAYAINYISSISRHQKISVLTWSAGSVDIAWAHQYWPSTRNLTSDVIQISGDRAGTVNAYALCPAWPSSTCAPSIIQQQANSTFIATLRNGGGSSAWAPTTSIYSMFDEIVQPQSGLVASAYVQDTRGVGVSNIEVQKICGLGVPGAGRYSHEGVLYHAIAMAATIDALTHDGPADLSRIDVVGLCQLYADSRMSVADVVTTEALAVHSSYQLSNYGSKVGVEPPIKAYAVKDIPAGY